MSGPDGWEEREHANEEAHDAAILEIDIDVQLADEYDMEPRTPMPVRCVVLGHFHSPTTGNCYRCGEPL